MTYEVRISAAAKRDLRQTLTYIRDTLLAPESALAICRDIEQEIQTLSENPARHPVIQLAYKGREVRRLYVRNYVVFYEIRPFRHFVVVLRVLYKAMAWQRLL
jgi:plasmid stabilization system protein ParE